MADARDESAGMAGRRLRAAVDGVLPDAADMQGRRKLAAAHRRPAIGWRLARVATGEAGVSICLLRNGSLL